MLNIDPIVRVDVRVGSSMATSGVFDRGAILGSNPVSGYFDTGNRYKEYNSLAEMAADGFLTTSPEYKAAAKYFGVDPAPTKVVLVYYFQNPAAADEAEEYDPSETYAKNAYAKHTESSVTKLYQCNTANTTGDWTASKWDEVTTVNENPSAAILDAIDQGAEFYSVYFIPKEGESAANIKTYIAGLASTLEGRNKGVVFYGFTGDFASAIAQDGLFNSLKDVGAKRALGLFCTEEEDDAAGLMGEAMGLSRMNPDTAFALCFKTVASATVNSLTQTQVEAIKNVNGNVYVQRSKDRAFVENGAAATGLRFDELLYVDRMSYDIQQAIYEIIANSTAKLPQEDSTSTIFLNAIHDVLEGYYAMDVLGTAAWRSASIAGIIERGDYVEHGHAEYVDSFDNQSDADRALHKAMPITVLLCLTGSVESIVITVDVQT